ncbi:MAG: peptidase [Euryarchaeota archaeon]|nr:peptidase [Euryarchaeota archaeon]
MEILAPAGSKDSLKAALLGGADAIYLSGKTFGARRFAPNFSDSELRAAIVAAHDRGAKVYVTVNTLIKQSELPTVYSYLDLLSSIEADAVIVQDRGLMRMIKENFPLAIHASTQMGVHSLEDAIWARNAGAERVILARELNLDEIERITKGANIGTEVFIHGALCYCFSGQCLFSSMLGGRSGNRGMCAQPCRKLYSLAGKTSFMLSTADLFCVDILPQLLRIGVSSIKIEGRLRSPTYVYLATKGYRAAVERAERGETELMTPRERELLEVAFNRGFSPGYLGGDQVMQRRYADSRGLPLGTARSRGREVWLPTTDLRDGDGITFYRGSYKVGGFEVKNPRQDGLGIVVSSPFRLEMGEYEVYKTKDREFPAIEKAISQVSLPNARAERIPRPFKLPEVSRGPRKALLSGHLSSIPSLRSALPFLDRVYFEMSDEEDEAREMCEAAGKEFVLALPRITPKIPKVDAPAVLVHSPGQALRYRDRRTYGSYSLNLFNSLTVPPLDQYAVSVELSRKDLADLTAHDLRALEVPVFGRIELMVTRDPSLEEGMLKDGRGKCFPVVRDSYGWAHILNSADLFLLDFLDELDRMGIDSYGLDLRGRPPELCAMVAKAFRQRDLGMKNRIKRRCGAITAGHYFRGVR